MKNRMVETRIKWLVSVLILSIIFILVLNFGVNPEESNKTGEQITPEIQSILESLDQAKEALLNKELTEASISLEQTSLKLWEALPLKVDNLFHVKRSPDFFGDVIKRENGPYYPGDVIRLYLEPRFYTIHEEDDIYLSHIIIDVKMLHEGEQIVFHQPAFLDFQKEGIHPMRDLFVDMSFNLGDGIPEGEYTILIELEDQFSGEMQTVKTIFDFKH